MPDVEPVIFIDESAFLNRTVFVPWSILGLVILAGGAALGGVAKLGRTDQPLVADCALVLVGAGVCCVTFGAISYGRLMWQAAEETRRQASWIASGQRSVPVRRPGARHG
jgi:hypothetical protein